MVNNRFLKIFHGDESKQPTQVNLLTCQLKVISDDKKFFDLVSYNRTYHLQSEDEADEWISVLLNSKVRRKEEKVHFAHKKLFFFLERVYLVFFWKIMGKCCELCV